MVHLLINHGNTMLGKYIVVSLKSFENVLSQILQKQVAKSKYVDVQFVANVVVS